MSNTNDDKTSEETPPLGAVLGWLNLSPTLPDNMTGATAASPPRFIDYNQLMEANRNAQNLQLAHEIVFNKDFQLALPEYEKGSITEKVHDTMHTAFWDILRADLVADPPRYEHVVKLIGEAKEDVKSLVLPHQTTLKNQIEEAIDLDTIKRRFEAKAADPHEYTKYFIDLMATLCAECRDENIAKLRTIEDPTDCFRNIMEVLSLMKLDMANFNIRQYRPLLQQQAIAYEKSTFDKFMDNQRGMGIDPLASTYKWLERAFNRLKTKDTIGWYHIPTDTTTSIPHESSLVILNEAYCELLLWNTKYTFPETLELDEIRYNQVHIATMRLLIISAIMTVLSHLTGSILREYEPIKIMLKSEMIILLDDFPQKRKLKDVLISISEQVVKTTRDELNKFDRAKIITDNEQQIKDAIIVIGENHVIEHAVFKLLFQRYVGFVHNVLDHSPSGTSLSNVAIPNGLNIVMNEVASTVSFFLRLITYNRMVFNEHYDRIISQLQSTSSSNK
ncbi:unnamed protein product [Rotaria socialis]|uniref:T-complex protein 11-like protein 1 n=1 Tax=Rotaria socialis TaxID=392032 RepID=A0A820G101_9BILA|nr:unnamed protein product [Rotaria socialis]CAF4272141.1 unnamed protein product [Rotaria socialis]